MENLDEIVPRIWHYIDGCCSAEEQLTIKQLIAENLAWKAAYQEVLRLHQHIDLLELEQPSLRFTKNVMEEITRLHIAPAARQYINSKVVWGIGAFFITLIVSFLAYGFSQVKFAAPTAEDSSLLQTVTHADYSNMFSNTFVNAFIGINVILGLMLFDRYLNSKKKQWV